MFGLIATVSGWFLIGFKLLKTQKIPCCVGVKNKFRMLMVLSLLTVK
ncbi:MAG: hypothetical protein RLZZ469_2011 [Bacteroidota bacterium]